MITAPSKEVPQVDKMNAEQILNSNRRRKNFAPKELNIIITMVEENADLIYNKVNSNWRFISKQDFWHSVTAMINENCNFAAKRDVKEVRRKWVTFQSEVKSKARDGSNVMSHHEKRVFDLISTHNPDVDERLTMLPLQPLSNNGLSPGQLPGKDQGSPSNTKLPSDVVSNLNNNFPVVTDQDKDVKVELPETTDNSAELLMNICSQVMNGITNTTDLTYQVNTIKEMIGSAPAQSDKSRFGVADSNNATQATLLPSSPITPLLVAPVIATSIPSVTPIRNVAPVQPSVQNSTNTSKRSRLDTENNENRTSVTSSGGGGGRQSGAKQGGAALHHGVHTDQVTAVLREVADNQRESNRIALERLEVARQRMLLEKEKLEIEKARYEIEKERLCQEIITRKKAT